jgi:hypothetical protein
VLPSENVVAVKELYIKQAQNGSLDVFSNEVVIIIQMKHINLVNLKRCGYCKNERLVVYVHNYDTNHIVLGMSHAYLSQATQSLFSTPYELVLFYKTSAICCSVPFSDVSMLSNIRLIVSSIYVWYVCY